MNWRADAQHRRAALAALMSKEARTFEHGPTGFLREVATPNLPMVVPSPSPAVGAARPSLRDAMGVAAGQLGQAGTATARTVGKGLGVVQAIDKLPEIAAKASRGYRGTMNAYYAQGGR